jgi:RNA polymerase sigma-70 factor (ECF subfamily)
MRALAGLAPADREVLLLTAWEGLEPARAARVLGVRPGTLAVRLHRARRRFARMLAAQDAAGADRADSQTATEPV